MNNIYPNTILYGVAGTGKTYSTLLYAVAIVEDISIKDVSSMEYSQVVKKFKEYKSKKLIESITFHQSYSYEEFIEGIKPNLNHNDVSYTLHNGIFKEFCNNQLDWNFLIHQDVSSKNAKHYKYIIDNITLDNINIKKFKLGTGQDAKIISIPISMVSSLIDDLKNNSITIMDLKNSTFEISSNYDTSILRYYKDIIANIIEKILINKNNISNKNKVFIIDEINRGNISNIFGELITLIEPSKRIGCLEETRLKLPYSNDYFGVPKNIYILGTMNSSDRSTVLFDNALRRRFQFVEMLPNYEIFKSLSVEGIDIYSMFKSINLRIEYLLGKDYLIGHTYFLKLLDYPNLDTLSNIFRYNILPLLQEYFFNDYSKIRLVLADNQTEVEEHQFIVEKSLNSDLFGNYDSDINTLYEINPKAFDIPNSYRKIYHHV